MFKRYRRWLIVALAVADALLILFGFAAAYWLRYEVEFIVPLAEQNYVPFGEYLPIALSLIVILIPVYALEGVYRRQRGRSWLDEAYALFKSTLIGIAVLVVITFYLRPLFYSRLMFAYVGILILVLLSGMRLAARNIRERLRRRGVGIDRVVIVGAGEIGRAIMASIVAQPELGYQVVGFVDDDPAKRATDIGRFKALGSTDDLPRLVREQAIDEAIITLPWMSRRKILSLMATCENEGVHFRIVPDLFQMSLSRVDIDEINGIPLIGVKEVSISGWNLTIKRGVDIIVASLGLVVLWPLMLLMGLLIKLDSPGPVIFTQTRMGKGGKPFTFYKFRSMKPEAEEELEKLWALNEASGPIFKIHDDPRMTGLGRFLRRTSLDELPQIYNVLRGEMSLVGPRPPIPDEVKRYQPWHLRRLEVSPGMTGLWQVSGRSELTFDEMVLLDLFYAENWSLWLDFKIMLRTIPVMLLGTGAY
jgi:exopolysaccharide biosynthesis polyprenyl glycosylphosphotransferase